MKNLTLQFYLLLSLFLVLFGVGITTKDIIKTNLLAGISLLLFLGAMRSLSRNSMKRGRDV
jgi:hypothetical protein